MSDWLDIGAAPALPVIAQDIADLKEQTVAFEDAWQRLTPRQRTFLETMQVCNFNARKTARRMNDETGTHPRWKASPDYVLCLDILRKFASKSVLNREKLIVRHDELVESLMTPKPVLHQGIPVMHEGEILYEIEAAAAAKVNKDLLEIGGHAKPADTGSAFGSGPALIIQVTNKIGGEVISTVNVGVVPNLPGPAEDEWLSIP